MSSENESDDGSNFENISSTPYSSPVQQVPGNSGNRLAYLEDVSLHSDGNTPYLKIIIEPQEQFRFRYKTEAGTHGCLQGRERDPKSPRTYPTVELRNYYGRAVIKCKLYQHMKDEEHPHSLQEEADSIPSAEVPDEGSYTVCFQGLGVIYKAQKDVPKLLYSKMEKNMKKEEFKKLDKKALRDELKKEAKRINLNIVRLRFSAHDINTDKEICEPVFSEPINNSKSPDTNELKICDLLPITGSAAGGCRIILLVEKISRGQVQVVIFEKDSEGTMEELATIPLTSDKVHHQYAAVFNMPPYKDVSIGESRQVFLQLRRVTDGRRSNAVPFIYLPARLHARKRKLNSSLSLSTPAASPASSIPSLVSTRSVNIPIENETFGQFTEGNNFQFDGQSNFNYNDPQMQHNMHLILDTGNKIVTETNLFNNIRIPMFNDTENMHPGTEVIEYNVVPVETTDEVWALNGGSLVDYGSRLSSAEDPVWGQAHAPPPLAAAAAPAQQPMDVTNEINFDSIFQESPLPPKCIQRAYNINEADKSDSGRPSRANGLSTKNRETKRDPDVVPQGPMCHTELTPLKTKVKEENDLVYFKAEDGLEVKKLIREIYRLKRNGSKDQLPEIQQKLERLSEIRLSNGDTFVHMALTSHLPSFRFVVEAAGGAEGAGAELLSAANHRGLTALHLAVIHDVHVAITLLIDKGCDPLWADDEGNTVIHHAAMEESTLRVLLEAIEKKGDKVDLDRLNHESQSPLHVAVLHGPAGSVRALLERGAGGAGGHRALQLAVEQDNLAAVRELLDFIQQPDLDGVNWKGMTALQIACAGEVRENTVEIVKLLLEKGASPHSWSQGGAPAWRYARRHSALWPLLQPYAPSHTLSPSLSPATSACTSSDDDDDFLSADDGESDSSGEMDIATVLKSVKLDGAINNKEF